MKRFLAPAILMLGMISAANAVAGEAEIRQMFKQLDPHTVLDSVKPSPIKGIYEVRIGTVIYYASEDGKYIISGNVFETSTQKNLTEAAKGKLYLDMVNKVGESGMIIYEPKQKAKRTLTVFTDVDCPYCRKFHSEVPSHLEKGIRIRYIVFPLRGLNTPTYKKEISVWCSNDRQKALTEAKTGKPVKQKECPNPIAQNLKLAHALGVDGTPTIMTDEGVLYRGYVAKDELYARLGLEPMKQASK